jgi:hypothetical protein
LTTPFDEIVTLTGLMVKPIALETVAPAATVTLALPAVAIRLAGTAAVNRVALVNVVASGEPFHCTVSLETKPVPVTVSVMAGPPAVAELGAMAVMARDGVIGWLRMANAEGPFPAANGEPGTGIKAPLLVTMAYAEMVLEK